MPALDSSIVRALELTSGCTEPAAVAYCASFAGKHLEGAPDRLVLSIDRRTYKNAFGAGIPGAGERRGCAWALYLGFIRACPERRLSIFSGLEAEHLAAADALAARDALTVELVDSEGLLISLLAENAANAVRVTLEGGHTRVTALTVNGAAIDLPWPTDPVEQGEDALFDDELYDPETWPATVETLFAGEQLRQTIRQGIAYNMAAALHGRKYVTTGPQTAESLVMGAIYARMNGDPIPVMSCAGSGNKGLTCMIPVVATARDMLVGEEKEIKAVITSVMLTTLITSRFGEVSSVCGAQYAAGAGVIAGLLYLKGKLPLFHGAYNNFVSAIGGGFCDGAKGSCSMRGNVAVSAALSAITHAENGFTVSGRDGFLGTTFRQTLENLVKYNPLIARFELETIRILQEK